MAFVLMYSRDWEIFMAFLGAGLALKNASISSDFSLVMKRMVEYWMTASNRWEFALAVFSWNLIERETERETERKRLDNQGIDTDSANRERQ